MPQPPIPEVLSKTMVFILASAVGIMAANLYYAQPLASIIGNELSLRPEAHGLVVTLTQMGYGLGVLLIIPMGDIVESRRLTLIMIGVAVLGLLGITFSSHAAPYFLAAFATGLGASAVQILVPYAAHFSPEKNRGQVMGTLMSGLMIGIMFSRPAAGLLTDLFSWRAIFILSIFLMITIAGVISSFLPPKPPTNRDLNYKKLLSSMGKLYLTLSVLRRRAFYQACLFGAFCLFWTASPLLLAGEEFHFSQSGIALFALAGVAGAVVAPLAGKAADKGFVRKATFIAMVSSAVSFIVPQFFKMGSSSSVGALVFSAILLDAGVTANLVLGQRTIFTLPSEFRSRINGLYMATIFVGGASGSALGAWAYARGGWDLTSWVGFGLPALALVVFLTEKRETQP